MIHYHYDPDLPPGLYFGIPDESVLPFRVENPLTVYVPFISEPHEGSAPLDDKAYATEAAAEAAIDAWKQENPGHYLEGFDRFSVIRLELA